MSIFDKNFEHGAGVRRSGRDSEWSFGTLSPNDGALPETTNPRRRSLAILLVGTFVLLGGLFVRAVVVSYGHPEFRQRAMNNHVRVFYSRAKRGIFYDSAGERLVQNESRDDVAIIPADFPRDPVERAATIAYLRDTVGADPAEIEKVLESSQYLYTPVSIKSRLTPDEKVKILVDFPNHAKGVTVVENFSRRYLGGPAFTHVLGYVGRISAEQLEERRDRYRPSDEIGKTGLEASYEADLRGEDGESSITVNAKGTKVGTLATSPEVDGCNLVLNVNAEFQTKVADLVASHLKRGGFDAAAVVLLDPRNGAVRAIVSHPTFDANLFADGIRGEKEVATYERLLEDPSKPFLNRTVSGMYPPGSTFKIVTAPAVLHEGAVRPDEYIDAPGKIIIAADLDPSLLFTYKDWKAEGHGLITITQAIEESSDTFFYKLTGGFEERKGIGPVALARYAEDFGFGAPTGIDLPSESAGVVPTPAWKAEELGEQWYQGDTYNFAIGQGYMLSTPLQVAAATMEIANGGVYYRPAIVRELKDCPDARTINPYVIRRNLAESEEIEIVRKGMRQAVTSTKGTAKALTGYSVPLAAKTGTAQFNNNTQEHSWFTVFAPYDQPEIVATVMVEGGGEGSATALPLARDILSAYFTIATAER